MEVPGRVSALYCVSDDAYVSVGTRCATSRVSSDSFVGSSAMSVNTYLDAERVHCFTTLHSMSVELDVMPLSVVECKRSSLLVFVLL